ncbi:MAG: ADP-ribosylglycohydrolase family protein [Spirochaetota bacterium]
MRGDTDVVEGAIVGAMCGDAAGATLEFTEGPVPAARVQRALDMVGGGPWQTAPGQVTDDGEMALSLMHALAGRDEFSVEAVAERYFDWFNSGPFDIGRTTTNGLSGARGREHGMLHQGMWEAAQSLNRESKANGALMRIAPLGAWSWRVEESEVVAAACDDAQLTHPNPVCQHASAVYCVAIRHLVLRLADAAGAFEIGRSIAEELADTEVLGWLDDAWSGADVGYSPHPGYVKYGFTHAFCHLARSTPYEEAIRETLSGGGDTDTNACIVGGLIGALHGIDGIPPRMADAVYSCDVNVGQRRPAYLQTREILGDLIARIV